MSRHLLEPRDNGVREVVVGWDGPTGTFYAVAVSHDNRILLDRGDPTDRIYQPQLVLDALRPYALIPDGLADQLLREALAESTGRTS